MLSAPGKINYFLLRYDKNGFDEKTKIILGGLPGSWYYLFPEVVNVVSTNAMLPSSVTVPMLSLYSVAGIRKPAGTANAVVDPDT
jgi:hypothetical protein